MMNGSLLMQIDYNVLSGAKQKRCINGLIYIILRINELVL